MTLHEGAVSHRKPEFKEPESHDEQEACLPLALEEGTMSFKAVVYQTSLQRQPGTKGRQRFAHRTHRGTTGPRELCPGSQYVPNGPSTE